MTPENSSINRDEWLASFVDQLMDGKPGDLSTAGADPETRALMETVLQLRRAFPKETPNAASMQRIRAGALSRWQSEEQKRARWRKVLRPDWLTQLWRPQFGAALAVVAVIVILVVAAPYLSMSGGSVTGSAGTGTSSGIASWVFLGILTVALIWLSRRKKP